jgi:hypothetical protein
MTHVHQSLPHRPGFTRCLAKGVWVILALFAAVACAGENKVVRGVYGGPVHRVAMVARNAAEYQRLVTVFGKQRVPPAPDFSRDMLVAVAMGRRSTGGYGIEILNTKVRGDVLYIRYRESTPAPGAFVSQAITTPYEIRVLPRSAAAKVMFERVYKPVVHPPIDPSR